MQLAWCSESGPWLVADRRLGAGCLSPLATYPASHDYSDLQIKPTLIKGDEPFWNTAAEAICAGWYGVMSIKTGLSSWHTNGLRNETKTHQGRPSRQLRGVRAEAALAFTNHY